MFKRLFWLTVGAGFGFGSSFWLMRAVRNTAQRYAPASLSRRVSAAVSEGREAMRQREAELRAASRQRPAD